MNREADKYFQENRPTAGLGRAALHSGMIVVAARLISVASQVVSMIIIGRLLGPHDFGLTTMIFALVGFGPMLIDLGTSEATSQKTHITETEVSSLFWLNVAIAVVSTALIAATSGLIADFYGEQALTGIALVSTLTFIAAGLSTQHSALLRRAMQFRSLAVVDITANVLSSILGIVLAATGWGYWSLVAKTVGASVLTAIGTWVCCPWIPMRPRYTPEVKDSVRFGLGVTGFTVTDYFALSADRIALGYFYGAAPLGYYQNAYLFYSNLLTLIAGPLHNIAVSSLSKLRGNLSEFNKSWALALSSVSFLSALAFALLAVTGADLIVLLLGQKWAPAGPLLVLFAIRGIAQITERTVGWLHVPAGRSDRWMRWGFVSALIQVVAVSCGLPFGPVGVAAACAISSYIVFIPALVYAGRPVGIGTRDVIAAVGPQTAAALAAVALGLLARHYFLGDVSELVRFVVSGLICLVTYLAVALLAFRVTAPLQLVLSALGNFNPLKLRRSP